MSLLFITCVALCCAFGLADRVIVNSLGDALADSSQCLPPQSANNACTLRSALSYCAFNMSSSSTQCYVTLPALGHVEMNASLGPIDQTFTRGMEVFLNGEGATISLDASSRLPQAPSCGLAYLHVSGNHDVIFQVRNASFTHFTESVFTLNAIDFDFTYSQFLNNNAVNGE